MIKVSVFYANTPGARFDHAYYCDKHMPLVKQRMGAHLLSYSVDKGFAGGTPDSPSLYVCSAHLLCESLDAFHAGFGPHAEEILADVPAYTDLTPIIEFSNVIVG